MTKTWQQSGLDKDPIKIRASQPLKPDYFDSGPYLTLSLSCAWPQLIRIDHRGDYRRASEELIWTGPSQSCKCAAGESPLEKTCKETSWEWVIPHSLPFGEWMLPLDIYPWVSHSLWGLIPFLGNLEWEIFPFVIECAHILGHLSKSNIQES